MARLKDKYRAEVAPALQQKFNYKNVMEIPRLEKIVINMGLGDCKDNAKALETAIGELEIIAEVDEIDMGSLKVGDVIPCTLDMNEESVFNGTVTEISALGVTRQNAAYFTVHLSIDVKAPLGASASIYLPKK